MADESRLGDMLECIPALKNLLNRKRVPILFIGSGISRRYIGLDDWSNLLKKVAKDIGISQSMLVGLIEQSKAESDTENYLPMLALKLSEKMINNLADGKLKQEDLSLFSEEDWKRSEAGEDPFKILISKYINNYRVTDNVDLLREMQLFKNLEERIPVVITTNYDTFLEDNIFKNFDIRVCPDDLYFSRFEGVGELLKIHGTVSNPNSMIITNKDYVNLAEEFKIITARITSLLCDHPIIFIGYSLKDAEIISLINDMVSCLKLTDQKLIQDNIIHIEYAEKENSIKYESTVKEINSNGKTIRTTQIYTNDILTILEYLNKFEPHMRPRDVRSLKGIISELVYTKESGKNKCRLVGIDDISSIDSEDVVVAVGYGNTIEIILNIITGFNPQDALEDVLKDNKNSILNMSKDIFFRWICNFKNNAPYLPIDYFMKKNDLTENDLPLTVREIREKMLSKLRKQIEQSSRKYPRDIKKEEIPQYLKDQTNYGNRYNAVMYFYDCNVINREECRAYIENLWLSQRAELKQKAIDTLQEHDDQDKSPKKISLPTEARKAIVWLDVPKQNH